MCPARSERAASLAISGSAPTTATGRPDRRTAATIPDESPPPPTGTTITSGAGSRAHNSSPSDAFPSITYGSSYALATYASGCSRASSATREARVTRVVSTRSTVPPNSRTASTFTRAELAGMTMVLRFPASVHASAMACPKFPEDAVMTCGCGTLATTFHAARNLKLPVC